MLSLFHTLYVYTVTDGIHVITQPLGEKVSKTTSFFFKIIKKTGKNLPVSAKLCIFAPTNPARFP